MMEFVRYSPGIEAPDPNFDTALQVVLDDLRKQVTASPRVEGQGLAIRNAHAKDYGVTRGEVEILANLPPEHAQGIYAKPGRHEAMVRFLHEPVPDADRGRDGAVAGEPVAARDRRETPPAAAGHPRRQSREDGCDLNVAVVRDRGAPAAGQHHAPARKCTACHRSCATSSTIRTERSRRISPRPSERGSGHCSRPMGFSQSRGILSADGSTGSRRSTSFPAASICSCRAFRRSTGSHVFRDLMAIREEGQ